LAPRCPRFCTPATIRASFCDSRILGLSRFDGEEELSIESGSEHHVRLVQHAEARLGGSDDGACMPVEIPVFSEFHRLTKYKMPWPKKLANNTWAPDAMSISLPAFKFNTCINAGFQLPLHAA
jgi:hypothetical protein